MVVPWAGALSNPSLPRDWAVSPWTWLNPSPGPVGQGVFRDVGYADPLAPENVDM